MPRIIWIATLLAIGVASFFGEHIQVAEGVGTDGQIYADMARSFPALLWDGSLPPYYAHRFVVPALIRGGLELFGLPLTNGNIWRAFAIGTILFQCASALLWAEIAKARSLTQPQAWLGFAGLFLNFEAAKNSHFMPVLLDSAAVMLSLLALLMFVRRQNLALVLASVIGGLTWSMASIVGALMLAFPATSNDTRTRPLHPLLFGLLLAVLPAAVAVYTVMMPPNCPLQPYANAFAGLPGKIPSHVCESAQAFVTFWPIGALVLLAGLRLVWANGWINRPGNLWLVFPAVALPELVAWGIANSALDAGADPLLIAEMSLTPAPGMFLLPIVSLAVFWGPLVLLAIVRWPEVCANAQRLGPAAVAIIALALVLMLPTEPRFITYCWPMIVLCTVEAYRDVSARLAAVFVALSIVTSKVWLIINTAPWGALEPFAYPYQRYFMSLGYWMAPASFWVQASMCLLLLVICALLVPRSRTTLRSASD